MAETRVSRLFSERQGIEVSITEEQVKKALAGGRDLYVRRLLDSLQEVEEERAEAGHGRLELGDVDEAALPGAIPVFEPGEDGGDADADEHHAVAGHPPPVGQDVDGGGRDG